MVNIIDANGITIDSLEDLITQYSDALRNIYGSDIVLDPESPDGLLVNFLAQVTRDASEFAVKLYNAESINSAIGSLLDQKVAWFGLTRKPASYTYVNVNITTINNVSLVGMDSNINPPANIYTVQDNSGNNYYLASSITLSANTTTSCSFRAENSGAVLVGAGTITTPVTYNQFITTINNPAPQYIIGVEEESDTELKWRLKSSYYLPSQGFCESLKATLLSYDDIEDAFVKDNPTNTTDSYGIDPYSVWVIVDCPDNAQTEQEVGDAIAVQNTAGTPTYHLADSYTTVDVNITTIADITTPGDSVDLEGIDGRTVIPDTVFTVKDTNDNEYYLETSVTLAENTTTSCTFRAKVSAPITVGMGEITTIVTTNSDIDSVSNPAAQSTIGQNNNAKSVTRQDSQGLFTTYYYNLVTTEPIYVYIDVVSTVAGFTFDSSYEDALKEAIVKGLGDFKIYGLCNTNDIIKICREFNEDLVVGECKLNTSTPTDPTDPTEYTIDTYAQPSNVNRKFVLDVANIFIKHP